MEMSGSGIEKLGKRNLLNDSDSRKVDLSIEICDAA